MATNSTASQSAFWREHRNKPISYHQAVLEGGDTGKRSPEERAHIVSRWIAWSYKREKLEEPDWFTARFPNFPAYRLNDWERLLVHRAPFLLVEKALCDLIDETDNEHDRECERVTLNLIKATVLNFVDAEEWTASDIDTHGWDKEPSSNEDEPA
jgi:hypothetical protein